MNIRPMQAQDWPEVRRIYAEGIATGKATFETTVPTWDHWDTNHLDTCRLVAEQNASILGWVALSQVSKREVYKGVTEISIYIGEAARGQGVGKKLMTQVIQEAEQAGIWTIQTTIFTNNKASLALHEKCGFRIVGTRKKIAKLNGLWRDTYLLEYRSKTIGTD